MPSPLTSTMLSANDAIYGWSPTGGDDEDVNVSPDLFFMTIQSLPSSSSAFLSPVCPPLDAALPKPCLPPPQLSHPQPKPPPQLHSITPSPFLQRAVSHSPIAPSSDRRAQRNRNRDPSWIPRPRNAFIIFRCEFSREHTQGSQDSQNEDDDDPNNATVKTLSKRAAEAWKQLSPSERERYKMLADKEREEHARLYPHYRFRPMKRQVSGTRKTTANVEGSKAARVPSVERPCAPSTHVPSVLASVPQKSRLSLSRERAEKAVPLLPIPPPASLPELSVSSYTTDAQTNPHVPLPLDFNDPLLLFSTAPSSESPPASADLYAPLPSIPFDTFRCHDSAFSLDQTKEDLEQVQDLEAYAIGLHNFDLFSPFSFPEYF